MIVSPFDIAFILLLAVVVPLVGIWEFRWLVVQRRAGNPGAGVQVYRWIICVEWLMALTACVWWYIAGREAVAIGLRFPIEGWGWWVGGLLSIAACGLLVVQSLVVLRDPAKVEAVRKQQGGSDLMALIPQDDREARWWPAVSLTAGVCEELVYRGFVIAILSSAFNVWVALGISALIFGLGHVYQGAIGVLKTGFFGLILGGLYVLTGSLWAPILVHFVIDLNSGLLMRRVMDAPASLDPMG